MSAIELMLELAGVPSETIAEVEKATPAAAALLKLAKDNEPLIRKIAAIAEEAQPLITQAMPLIKQAMVEIDALMPAARDVLYFLQKQKPPA